MPIPFKMNPMGTLGVVELPYVQPIMTGYNTWSNKPSFGMTIVTNTNSEQNAIWRAWYPFSATSTYEWVAGYDTFETYGRAGYVDWIFAQPLKIDSLQLLGGSNQRATLVVLYNGDTNIELGRVLLPQNGSATLYAGQEETRHYKVLLASNGYPGVLKININATYKP